MTTTAPLSPAAEQALFDLTLVLFYPDHARSGVKPDAIDHDVDLADVKGLEALVVDFEGDLWVQRADGWHLVAQGGKESPYGDSADFLMGREADADDDKGFAPFALIREGLPVE